MIRRHWTKYRDSDNIGIVTGPRSGLVVIDLDNRDGKDGSETLAALEAEHGKLTSLPTAFTVPGTISELGVNASTFGVMAATSAASSARPPDREDHSGLEM